MQIKKNRHLNLPPIVRKLRLLLKNTYGARLKKIILFGSYARGQADNESDVDLLIVLNELGNLKKELGRLVPLIAELNLEYGILVSCLPIGFAEYQKADTPFLMNVNREGVTIHE